MKKGPPRPGCVGSLWQLFRAARLVGLFGLRRQRRRFGIWSAADLDCGGNDAVLDFNPGGPVEADLAAEPPRPAPAQTPCSPRPSRTGDSAPPLDSARGTPGRPSLPSVVSACPQSYPERQILVNKDSRPLLRLRHKPPTLRSRDSQVKSGALINLSVGGVESEG